MSAVERFATARYHVHGAACGPHRETGLEDAGVRFARLLAAPADVTQDPWVTRATGEPLTDEEAAFFEEVRGTYDRLFIGAFPGGMVYADRGIEEHGDYARVAFLDYGTLALRWDRAGSPLRSRVLAHARTLQAQAGELYALSTTALRDRDGRLVGCGQTVRLGSRA